MKAFRKLIPFLIGILILSCSKDPIEAPIVPQNPPSSFEISVSPTDITANSASIAWSESTDPEGKAITYSLLVNGVITAENMKGLTYALKDLEAATKYNIEVVAHDPDKQSTSTRYSFTTQKEEEKKEEHNLLFVEVDIDKITFNSALVKWASATAPTDKTITYDISLNSKEISTGMKSSWFEFTDLEPLTEYSATVTAKAKDGKVSTETVVFTTLKTPPNPSPFTIDVEEESNFFATIRWTKSIDPDEGAILYDVYLDDVLLLSDISETLHSFQNLRDDKRYIAKIVAKTDKGGTTTVTQELMTTPAGGPLPDFQISVSAIDTQSALIEWNEVIAQNGNGVTYDLYTDGTLKAGDLTDARYALSGLNHNTTYSVRVVAKAMGHPSSENRSSFKTLEAPSNFMVESVTLYDAFAFGGTTNPPSILVKNVTGFNEVSNLILTIGNRTYPINGIISGNSSINISQTVYDEIKAETGRNALFTFRDNTDNSDKQYSIAFTFN